MNRTLSALALVAFALSATGCDGFSDFVDDPLGDFELQVRITDAEIPLGDDGISVGVRPGEETTVEGSIDIEKDFGRVDVIESLEIRAEDMVFTADATPNGRGMAAPSGVIRLGLEFRGGSGTRPFPVVRDIEVVEGRIVTDIVLDQQVVDMSVNLINQGSVRYSVTTFVVSTTDPSQPLSGTFFINGYTGTITATPDA